METRLTKKDIEYNLDQAIHCYGSRHVGKTIFGLMCEEMLKYKDIEEKLGFGLNELVEMLINGIWEVGGVDSGTMKPREDCLQHFYVYGVDLENGKLLVFNHILPYKRSVEMCNNVLFSTLDLNKYKQKCLSGWGVTKEELLNE